MQAITTNKKLIEGYLELFKNLSSGNKRDLISGLSESLTDTITEESGSLRSKLGDFIPEKNADIIIGELRAARTFTRDIEPF